MAEPNLFAFLSADPSVAALIGNAIYPDLIPQHHFDGAAVMPAVVFQRNGTDRQTMMCATDDLVGATYQLDVSATTVDAKVAAARAIRRALVDYSGPMGDASVSRVILDNEFDSGPEPEPGLFRRTLLVTIWYREN